MGTDLHPNEDWEMVGNTNNIDSSSQTSNVFSKLLNGVEAVANFVSTTENPIRQRNVSASGYTTSSTTLTPPTTPSTTIPTSTVSSTTAASLIDRIREFVTNPPNVFRYQDDETTTTSTTTQRSIFAAFSTPSPLLPTTSTISPGEVYFNNMFGAEPLSAEINRNITNNLDRPFESLETLFPQALTAQLATLSPALNSSCGRVNIMGTIVEDSTPYLFPFIIEYSLIGAAVIYVMWKHIGRNPRYTGEEDLEHRLEIMLSRRAVALAQANSGRVDCVGASKGLFFGLLLLVGSLICLILFFVLVRHPQLSLLAIYLADVSHSALIAFSLIAIFIGFIRFVTNNLHYKFFFANFCFHITESRH